MLYELGILLAALAGVASFFCMTWPWKWADRRKLTRNLSRQGSSLSEMKGSWRAKWERVAKWTWIPVREYAVIYIDQSGRRHQALAEFYLPWWLNKFHDAGLTDNFDLTEQNIQEGKD
jgi:hypothetical protein